ncbi:MAG: hypothetical protein P8178_03735 [Candidatus Thiodiazotropha sp.]
MPPLETAKTDSDCKLLPPAPEAAELPKDGPTYRARATTNSNIALYFSHLRYITQRSAAYDSGKTDTAAWANGELSPAQTKTPAILAGVFIANRELT